MPRGKWRPRLLRIGRAVTITVLGVAFLYLVAANAFLSTTLFARVVNADPETLEVHYQRGWSVWPGRVHARGLTIRSTDANVEWILTMDDVDFDVSLLGLPRRRFEVSRVRARGVELRLRQRLAALPRSPAAVAALPPIDGLPPYGLRAHVEDDNAVWDDRFWNLWTARLDDVVSDDTREIWIDDHRFVGRARVTGGFYLRPMRLVDVGLVHVDVEGGDVLRGPTRVLQGVRGSADVSLSSFDPRTTHGLAVLGHLTLSADVRVRRAALPDLGMTATEVHLEGRSAPGATRFDVEGELAGEVGKTRFGGRARVAIRARGIGGDADGVDLSGSQLSVQEIAAHGVPGDTIRWHGRTTATRAALHLRERAIDASVVLDARDARPLVAALLDDDVPAIFAPATDVPHLEAFAKVRIAPGLVFVHDLVARGGDVAAGGVYAVRGAHRRGAFVLEKGSVAAGVELADEGVRVRLGDLSGWMREERGRVEDLASGREPASPPRRATRKSP